MTGKGLAEFQHGLRLEGLQVGTAGNPGVAGVEEVEGEDAPAAVVHTPDAAVGVVAVVIQCFVEGA